MIIIFFQNGEIPEGADIFPASFYISSDFGPLGDTSEQPQISGDVSDLVTIEEVV